MLNEIDNEGSKVNILTVTRTSYAKLLALAPKERQLFSPNWQYSYQEEDTNRSTVKTSTL